ncbi:glycosyl transferase family 1 [Duganella sp. Leaf61]|uniref:TIGR04063 family PEP-CTERM/XrtA system glycosyltransferase n=1 Tax=Duganella sp. Leaf61 TaxID=1736227 RepID=UPI0006F3EAD7|nr:TIGR04063 family PEP-CTERM/XrtA system glycosyltransferase [Duganella sp. Leaf61]KQN69413.1 glycosyl transferase family 1 [Duganella sp. Leaf61]
MSWRILHILDHSLPLHSGYTFRTAAILRHQRARGWHTSQLTSARQGGSGGEHLVDGCNFYRTRELATWWTRLPVLRQVGLVVGLSRRLRQVVQRERPDVLHAHSPGLNALAALRVGRALGIPVVYEIRAFWEDAAADHGTSPAGNLRYRLTRALDNYLLRRVDAVTTICEGLRADLVARGVPAARVTVVPNAVDLEQFAAVPSAAGMLAHQLGLTGKLVIGFIGSFYAYEGLGLLIESLPKMLASVPSLHLLLVGGGPQEAALRARSAQLGIEHRVTFAGRVEHERIAGYYALIDIMVYPRLPMRLTNLVTPLKPLEAMAQHRLVVASDVGGHRELIEDGKTGLLFRAGDADALAAQVVRLLRQPDTWPMMRLQARAFVEQQRNWPASVARYRAVYQQLAPR